MIRVLLLIVPLLFAAGNGGPFPPKEGARRGPKIEMRRGTQAQEAPTEGEEGEGAGRGAKPAKSPGMLMGAAALHGGSPMAAVRLYKTQVEKNPEAPAPNVALGRAYAKAGRCRDALDQLWPWINSTPFGANAALAASSCSARLGLHADAIYFDMIALEERPNNVGALTSLAGDLYMVGDPVSAEEVLDRLTYGLKRGNDRSFYARAAQAVRTGDVQEFDTLVTLLERDGRTADEMRRMSAQLWLDLGDPVTALETFGRTVRPSQRVIRAEALRRTGFWEDAENTINARVRGRTESIAADAVRARVQTDAGDFAKAREILDVWEAVDSPDLAASEWYLARAQKDEAGMKKWAEAYAPLQDSPLRTLDLLIPINAAP